MRHINSNIIIFCVVLFALASCGSTNAVIDQSEKPITNVRGIDNQAKKYFNAGKYKEALELYKRLKSSKENLLYKGISAYYVGEYELSLRSLTDSYASGNKDKRLYVYMADSYLALGKYAEATEFYKNYLHLIDKDSPQRSEIIHKIKRCGFAKDYQYVDQLAFVENLGTSVNSEYKELSALQSPTNPNKYYFSSNRNGSTGGLRTYEGKKDDVYGFYSTDIYAIETKDGNWNSVASIDPILNTSRNDVIQDFSKDGKILYYIKSNDLLTGSLLTDTFRTNREDIIFPKAMQCPIVGELGDKDLRVFNENTYLFASKRKGGYGGYDLYIVTREDGVWSDPINLGPEINTEFDELAPYLTKNGNKIYFSSNRLTSLGGFDIFESQFGLETAKWNTPLNLGLPINSPRDDLYFRLANDGLSAIMSSNRNETIGDFDLYMIYFKNKVQDQMNLSYSVPFLNMRNLDIPVVEENPVKDIVEETKEVEKEIKKDYSGVQKREVVISPLFYNTSENIMNPQNLSQLNKVVETMKIFPESKIEITGHSVSEGLPEFDLYFSIKRAEKAADYLLENGIASNRIFLRGVGTQYNKVSPRSVALANKYNRRIDLRIVTPLGVPLRVIYDNPTIPIQSKDRSYDKFNSFQNGLTYKISLTTTKQMYKNRIVRNESDIMIDRDFDNDKYLYTLGIYNTYSSARSAKSRLTRNGQFDSVSIEPYIDGQLIDRNDVEKYRSKYSDLSNFILYEKSK